MNLFFCGLRTDGGAISKRELFGYLARLPKQNEWDSASEGAFSAVALPPRAAMRPLVAQYRGMIAAGDVRLDNRAEIARAAGLYDELASDLEIVAAAIDRHGADIIPRIYGDFAFVAWDARAQKLIAARDAFGVKPLFYRRTAQHLLLSSRLEPLCGDESIDCDYVADFLIGRDGPSTRTIWEGAMQLEPGALLVQRGSVTAQSRYWNARSFAPVGQLDEGSAVEEFRQLFADSITNRVSAGETWAQLSGGLDSSSIVSTAEWLKENRGTPGLSGTVTIAETLGTGDERRFSDTVLGRYGLNNEVVRDYWPWRNDSDRAPRATDEPTPLFPFFARDRRMVDVVTQAGGKVLLSGLGSDHYLFTSAGYIADMLVRGSVKQSAREVMGWALQTRRSFWHTARMHVVEPIVHNYLRHSGVSLPAWLHQDFARKHHVVDRLADLRGPRAKLGQIYRTNTAVDLARVANWVQRGPFQDRVEMRYPFLSRQLVEFALQLPPSMKVRPEGRKWVLREAMRGIVPEEVRTRMHKGGIDAGILATLERERPLIDALLTDPIVAQLGCLNMGEFKKTVELARQGEWRNTVHLFSVLALESWLRARNGAWPVELDAQQTAA